MEKAIELAQMFALVIALLTLAGCASVPDGPGQVPGAPYQQQGDPRDTSGMH